MKAKTLIAVALALFLSTQVALAAHDPGHDESRADDGGITDLGREAGDTVRNGFSADILTTKTDTPIFLQYAVPEGTLTQYHVLKPKIFYTLPETTNIFQFQGCDSLAPVTDRPETPENAGEANSPWPAFTPGVDEFDTPTRQIVNVVGNTDCTQYESVEAIQDAAAAGDLLLIPTNTWVNAHILPEKPWPPADGTPIDQLSDEELFNAPPYRPRVDVFAEGEQRSMITYELTSDAQWANTAFPSPRDVYVLSYGPGYIEEFTIFNVADGTPLDASADTYSPIWLANCIEKEGEGCGSYNFDNYDRQPTSLDDALAQDARDGTPSRVIDHPAFNVVNCPMVSVDVNQDRHLDWGEGPHNTVEDLDFPDLWVDGGTVDVTGR